VLITANHVVFDRSFLEALNARIRAAKTAYSIWSHGSVHSRVPHGGVGAVGKWPATATVHESGGGGLLIHSGGHRGSSVGFGP